MEKALPAIPAKRYFTIGEVSELCGVKPYVLRYWEQEFTQLKPMKRRGNRRYYQHHEVLLIRRIRDLLYDQGFTISGARNRLAEQARRGAAGAATTATRCAEVRAEDDRRRQSTTGSECRRERCTAGAAGAGRRRQSSSTQLRAELLSIRELLVGLSRAARAAIIRRFVGV